jgi:glycosyltransferase involved in cell wall biosynthesis
VNRRPFGWSVLAYAAAELGVGEAGRRVAAAVRQSGLPTELVGVATGSESRQQHRHGYSVRETVGFENTVICVNADQLPHLFHELDLVQLRGSHVGMWFWELDAFPERFHGAFALVKEVWVASEFTRAAVAAVADRPVRKVTLPILRPEGPTRFTRRSLGLPEDRFCFLTNFDYFSTCERKNPIGTIRAYTQAFAPDDGACLVVKSINGHRRPEEAARVRDCAAGRPDVHFLDDYVSAAGMKAMIELADVYVSLHRAEGYGLNLADAMVVGTPTIATGYSGNMDFMDDTSSALVGYDLVEVGPHAFPYDADAVWAQPRLDEASTAMRWLFTDRVGAAALAERARVSTERFTLARAGLEVRDLLIPEMSSVGRDG